MFYGSNDPTNSVKALKEDRVLRIRLQSHQVHPTVPVSKDGLVEKHAALALALRLIYCHGERWPDGELP